MTKYIISYASKGYYKLQDNFMLSVKDSGYRKVYYTDKWMKSKCFYKENQQIFSQKKGAGYWLWKPYIIKDRLEKMDFGDILFYCDVDVTINKSITPLFDLCNKKDILLFKNGNKKNGNWTKRDCFILMGADCERYYESPQVEAGIIFLKKTIRNINLVNEWIKFASDERILTDLSNQLGKENLPSFKEHRHDQSILGILACMNDIELFRDPSEYGNAYKFDQIRQHNEYLENGYYEELDVLRNSNYETILTSNNEINFKDQLYSKLLRQFKQIKPFIS